MPHHITLDHISYAHPGEPPLFTDLSAVFSAPLTGLIGDNGAGKTTLFNIPGVAYGVVKAGGIFARFQRIKRLQYFCNSKNIGKMLMPTQP